MKKKAKVVKKVDKWKLKYKELQDDMRRKDNNTRFETRRLEEMIELLNRNITQLEEQVQSKQKIIDIQKYESKWIKDTLRLSMLSAEKLATLRDIAPEASDPLNQFDHRYYN